MPLQALHQEEQMSVSSHTLLYHHKLTVFLYSETECLPACTAVIKFPTTVQQSLNNGTNKNVKTILMMFWHLEKPKAKSAQESISSDLFFAQWRQTATPYYVCSNLARSVFLVILYLHDSTESIMMLRGVLTDHNALNCRSSKWVH